jgi:hypothetical protein
VLPRVKQRTVLSKCPAKSRSRWSRATSRVAPQRSGRVLEGGAAGNRQGCRARRPTGREKRDGQSSGEEARSHCVLLYAAPGEAVTD